MTNYAINFGGKLLSGQLREAGRDKDDNGILVGDDFDFDGELTREDLIARVVAALSALDLIEREEAQRKEREQRRETAAAAAIWAELGNTTWKPFLQLTEPQKVPYLAAARKAIKAVDRLAREDG